jgi:hypothetical protein
LELKSAPLGTVVVFITSLHLQLDPLHIFTLLLLRHILKKDACTVLNLLTKLVNPVNSVADKKYFRELEEKFLDYG